MEPGTDKLLQKKPADLPPGMKLHRAALTGDTRAIQQLIKSGVSVDTKDDYQYTPLHQAAANGHTPAVQLLIAHGASVNATGDLQATPLYLATLGGHVEAARERSCS